jgi:uncharacterized protein (TIGR02265 family)
VPTRANLRPVQPAPAIDDDSFLAPDFTGPLDPAPYLALLPDDETCRGLFFHGVIDFAKRVHRGAIDPLFEGMQNQRFVAFRDYPLREHMKLTLNAVKLLYPRVPSREGVRRLGWLAFSSMAESMVGRVVFGVLGRDPDAILSAGPRSVAVSLRRGRLTARRLGRGHWRLSFEHIYGFLDTYYVGVVEGALKAQDVVPRVRIRLHSLVEGEMDVTWV